METSYHLPLRSPVQTQSKRYLIVDATDVIIVLLLCTSVLLLSIPHAVTYTEAEINLTALNFIEQFLGNSLKITNQLFFKNLFAWLI